MFCAPYPSANHSRAGELMDVACVYVSAAYHSSNARRVPFRLPRGTQCLDRHTDTLSHQFNNSAI